MRQVKPSYIPSATRLSFRRLARAFSYPGGQLGLAFCLTVYSILIEVPWFAPLTWFLGISLISIVQDLAEPHSRLMAFVHWLGRSLPVARFNRASRDLSGEYRVFSVYPLPPLFKYRRFCRLILPLFTLIVTWAYAIALNRIPFDQVSHEEKWIVTHLLLVSGVISFAVTCVTRLDGITWRRNYLFWLTIPFLGCLTYLFSFWPTTYDAVGWIKLGSGMLFYLTLYGTVFVFQRLSSGERVINEVIRDMSLHFLGYEDMERLREVPYLIGQKLRHERVYILMPDEQRENLKVTALYGDFAAADGAMVPITQSLTGLSFSKQKVIVWNDVRACPYYHGLHGDDTRAEIAVPVSYRGDVYAILDVQSTTVGVYGPGDVHALETIAQILGTAIGASRRDALFSQAVQLWEQMIITTNAAFSSEAEVFELFADFAQKYLQADVVTYFPLSITGCPIHKPMVYGQLRYPELISPPRNDPKSWLVRLISRWEPFYEEKASNITPEISSNAVGFITREKVVSTCFMPVGTRQERLAGLFLNFRQPKQFDLLFRFTILGLAQSLAKAVAQIRYRDLVFQGIGRPELGLHNIIGRHGLKAGVVSQAAAIRQQCQKNCCALDDAACGLHNLLQQTDAFLDELKLVESARPPLVWRESLKHKLEEYVINLPQRADGRRPVVNLDVEPAIERESPWLKLALYRIVTEAIANAIFHGAAATLRVQLQRTVRTVEVGIQNNGVPLPEEAPKRRSNYGIYALLEECERAMGAATNIARSENERGTMVTLIIPALPYTSPTQETRL